MFPGDRVLAVNTVYTRATRLMLKLIHTTLPEVWGHLDSRPATGDRDNDSAYFGKRGSPLGQEFFSVDGGSGSYINAVFFCSWPVFLRGFVWPFCPCGGDAIVSFINPAVPLCNLSPISMSGAADNLCSCNVNGSSEVLTLWSGP